MRRRDAMYKVAPVSAHRATRGTRACGRPGMTAAVAEPWPHSLSSQERRAWSNQLQAFPRSATRSAQGCAVVPSLAKFPEGPLHVTNALPTDPRATRGDTQELGEFEVPSTIALTEHEWRLEAKLWNVRLRQRRQNGALTAHSCAGNADGDCEAFGNALPTPANASPSAPALLP